MGCHMKLEVSEAEAELCATVIVAAAGDVQVTIKHYAWWQHSTECKYTIRGSVSGGALARLKQLARENPDQLLQLLERANQQLIGSGYTGYEDSQSGATVYVNHFQVWSVLANLQEDARRRDSAARVILHVQALRYQEGITVENSSGREKSISNTPELAGRRGYNHLLEMLNEDPIHFQSVLERAKPLLQGESMWRDGEVTVTNTAVLDVLRDLQEVLRRKNMAAKNILSQSGVTIRSLAWGGAYAHLIKIAEENPTHLQSLLERAKASLLQKTSSESGSRDLSPSELRESLLSIMTELQTLADSSHEHGGREEEPCTSQGKDVSSGDFSGGGSVDLPSSSGDAGDLPSSSDDAGDLPSSSGDAGDLPSSSGDAGDLPSNNGDAGDLPSSNGDAGDLPSSNGGAGDLPSNNGDAGDLPSSNGDAGDLPSSNGDAGDLPSSNGDAGDLPSSNGDAGELPSSSGDAGDLPSSNGDAGDLPSSNGDVGDLPSSNGDAGDLPSSNGDAGDLPSSNGDAGDLPSSNGDAGDLPSSNGDAGELPSSSGGSGSLPSSNGDDSSDQECSPSPMFCRDPTSPTFFKYILDDDDDFLTAIGDVSVSGARGCSGKRLIGPQHVAGRLTYKRKGTALQLEDLSTVHKELYDARLNWYNLGMKLGVRVSVLNRINWFSMRSSSDCLREVLQHWLQFSPCPTWEEVCAAHRSYSVREYQLAQQLEETYGPVAECRAEDRALQLEDLNAVHDELYDARFKWYNLGMKLGVRVSVLNRINWFSMRSSSDCLREVLQHWLQFSPCPTWEEVCAALRSYSVREYQLAQQLEETYGPVAKCRAAGRDEQLQVNFGTVFKKLSSINQCLESCFKWRLTGVVQKYSDLSNSLLDYVLLEWLEPNTRTKLCQEAYWRSCDNRRSTTCMHAKRWKREAARNIVASSAVASSA